MVFGCMQGMTIDDSELREYTHGMFGSIAGLMKQEFQPYLATCVAAALASCNQVCPLPCNGLVRLSQTLCSLFVSKRNQQGVKKHHNWKKRNGRKKLKLQMKTNVFVSQSTSKHFGTADTFLNVLACEL